MRIYLANYPKQHWDHDIQNNGSNVTAIIYLPNDFFWIHKVQHEREVNSKKRIGWSSLLSCPLEKIYHSIKDPNWSLAQENKKSDEQTRGNLKEMEFVFGLQIWMIRSLFFFVWKRGVIFFLLFWRLFSWLQMKRDLLCIWRCEGFVLMISFYRFYCE